MDFLGRGRLLGGDGRTGTETEATSHFSSPFETPPWPRSIMRALYGARPGREATDGVRRGSPSHFNACKKGASRAWRDTQFANSRKALALVLAPGLTPLFQVRERRGKATDER